MNKLYSPRYKEYYRDLELMAHDNMKGWYSHLFYDKTWDNRQFNEQDLLTMYWLLFENLKKKGYKIYKIKRKVGR